MIPLRLQLSNFMSYGEGVPALHLADVRLACLSGDNGNGKSALLDAMTWALFGETRARTEDDVIRLGTRAAGVIFEFEVAGNHYRIDKRRDRSKGMSWEFQIRQDDGGFRSLSGTNARETKERIQSVLRMDYKTFLTTSYLRQGEADAFCKATAGERKEVLARILDLSRYDALEALAREKGRDATQREADADRTLTEIDADLEREDEVVSALREAEALVAAGQAGIDDAQRDYEAALARCQALETVAESAEAMREKIRDNEESLSRERYDEAERESRLKDADRTLARKPELDAALSRRASLDGELEPLECRWSQSVAVQNEARRLESLLTDAQRERERALARFDQELALLQRDAQRAAELQERIAQRERERAALVESMLPQDATAETLRAAETLVGDLKARHIALKAEQDKLERRRSALVGGTSSECEWCGQPLTAAGRALALAETDDALEKRAEEMTALVSDGREAKRQLDEARNSSDELRARADLLARTESELHRLSADEAPLRNALLKVPTLTRERQALYDELARADYLTAEREQLHRLTAELSELEQVGRRVSQLRRELDSLRDLDRDLERLRVAEEVARIEPERLAALKVTIEDRRKRIEKARTLVATQDAKLASLPTLRGERDIASRTLSGRQSELQAAQRNVGQLAGEAERLERRKAERVSWSSHREEARRDLETFRELTAAFGKRGVQALIIENALPEIEEEANRLLGRMTQGSLQLRLKTTRDAKTKGGGPIETLDIILFDEAGERPYELFSGGEAFRVNLALRVALSRTLARRAGAPLQTLILDEGFGTQDPRGREAISEALHSVSEDFALVLAITHIDDLKESFPTRIEVTKGENGSTFTVQ